MSDAPKTSNVKRFTEAVEAEREREAELEKQSLKRGSENTRQVILKTLNPQDFAALGIDTEADFETLDYPKNSSGKAFREAMLGYRARVETEAGELELHIYASMEKTTPRVALAEGYSARMVPHNIEENRVSVGRVIEYGEQLLDRARQARERQVADNLKKKLNGPLPTNEELNSIQSVISENADLLDMQGVLKELQETVVDRRELLATYEESEKRKLAQSMEQAEDVIRMAKVYVAERKAHELSVQGWIEGETERLWKPWSYQLVRYMAARPIAIPEGEFEDVNPDDLVEAMTYEAAILEGDPFASDHPWLTAVRYNGSTYRLKIGSPIDAVEVFIEEPDFERAMLYHRTTEAKCYPARYVNVPPMTEANPAPPPREIESFNARLQQLELGGLTSRQRDNLYRATKESIAKSTPEALLAGELDYGYEDYAPFELPF